MKGDAYTGRAAMWTASTRQCALQRWGARAAGASTDLLRCIAVLRCPPRFVDVPFYVTCPLRRVRGQLTRQDRRLLTRRPNFFYGPGSGVRAVVFGGGAQAVVLMCWPRCVGRFGAGAADCTASSNWVAVAAWMSSARLSTAMPTSCFRPVSAKLVESLAMPMTSMLLSW